MTRLLALALALGASQAEHRRVPADQLSGVHQRIHAMTKLDDFRCHAGAEIVSLRLPWCLGDGLYLAVTVTMW